MLDEENLQLSNGCRNAILEIQNQPTYYRLKRFYKTFGREKFSIFVRSILLKVCV